MLDRFLRAWTFLPLYTTEPERGETGCHISKVNGTPDVPTEGRAAREGRYSRHRGDSERKMADRANIPPGINWTAKEMCHCLLP